MADADPFVCQDALPHHWLIDPPGGPTSKGVCSRCHVERDFSNSDRIVPAWNKSAEAAHAARRKSTTSHPTARQRVA